MYILQSTIYLQLPIMLPVQRWYVECISIEDNRSILCVHLTLCCSSATSPNLHQVAYHLPQKQLRRGSGNIFNLLLTTWMFSETICRLVVPKFFGTADMAETQFQKRTYSKIHGTSWSFKEHAVGSQEWFSFACLWLNCAMVYGGLRWSSRWSPSSTVQGINRKTMNSSMCGTSTYTHKTHPRKEMQKVRISAHPLTAMTRII